MSLGGDPSADSKQKVAEARLNAELAAWKLTLADDGLDSGSDEDEAEEIASSFANSLAGTHLTIDTYFCWSMDLRLGRVVPHSLLSAATEFNLARGEEVPQSATVTSGTTFHEGLATAMNAMGVRQLTLEATVKAPHCVNSIDGSDAKLIDLTSFDNLESLTIKGDPDIPLWIAVNDRAQVSAIDMSEPALRKSCVCFFDEEGQWVVRPLHGQIHERRALEFQVEGESLDDDVQLRVFDHQLNGAAPPLAQERPDGTIDEVSMDCRVLTGIALNMMLDKETVRAQTGEAERTSYEALRNTDGIVQQASRGVIEDLGRMYKQGACAIFAVDELGTVAFEEFQQMEPGGQRCFVLGTPQPHFMGLTLRHKQLPADKSEFVEKLYDPNVSVHHQRAVFGDLSSLRSQNLENWVGRGVREQGNTFRTYFPAWPALACLYRWPPTDEPSRVRLFLSDGALASEALLHELMVNGHSAEVSDWIGRQVEQAHGGKLPPGELERRLRGASTGPGGALQMTAALEHPKDHPYLCPKPDAIKAYIRGVLAIDEALLDAGAKFRLLRGSTWMDSPMTIAMGGSGIETPMAIAEEILAAPEGSLTPEQVSGLLRPDVAFARVNKNLAAPFRAQLAREVRPAVRSWLEQTIGLLEGAGASNA